MFKVYWTEKSFTDSLAPGEIFEARSRDFESDKMSDALKFMEQLRQSDSNSFVIMSSENPNSVGKPGADDVGPAYSWTKRRNHMPSVKK